MRPSIGDPFWRDNDFETCLQPILAKNLTIQTLKAHPTTVKGMSEYTWLLEKTNNKWFYCIPCETFIQHVSVHECDDDHETTPFYSKSTIVTNTLVYYTTPSGRWPDGYPPWHTS